MNQQSQDTQDQEVEILQDELATLKARADKLGISYHPSIGLEKLRDKVIAALADVPLASDDLVAPVVAPAVEVESEGARRKRMKNASLELIRIRVTCMNPAKKEWDGEILTVGNRLVGTVKKFVPFNADAGWHVPRIMLDMMQARQCQVFTTLKSAHGVSIRQGKLIKEFAIEILDPLTTDELHDLAQRQAMAQSVG